MMKVQFSYICLRVGILLMLLENHRTNCFQRLLMRRLTSNEMSGQNSNDIREILTASLTASEPRAPIKDEKRDTSIDSADDKSSMEVSLEDDNDNNNAASDSKGASIYEDEIDEEDEGSQRRGRQVDEADESKRNSIAVSAENPVDKEVSNDDESSLKNVKEVAKREVRNDDNYDDDDFEVDSESVDSSVENDPKSNEVARSTLEERNSAADDLEKIDSPREASAVEASDPDYEKQIEDQIQQRIDSIKEDIKRQIERKQQAREIEANNAKFDELEFSRDEDEVEPAPSDSSKRSASDNNEAVRHEAQNSMSNARSKRRSSEVNEVKQSDTSDAKSSAQPMKKRSYVKRVGLVEKRDAGKRKDRSSIIIPERGRAEVRDDLPADLTLDPKLRVARSYEKQKEPEASRSARSASESTDEHPAGRWRRNMPDALEDKENEAPEKSSNFLFAPGEISDPRARRRRSRGRNRSRSSDREQDRQHPCHSRHHRAMRESLIGEANRVEERAKRAMPLDENAAMEYKESFGGFPSESEGALGRFKRIKRSAKIS